ncbi:hypothetical protein RND81_14G237300 [Saponaria officinalis]|uniref:S-methyl-5-thioribose kinase n=1 Tax=Saponaria officinalis TaxID=3572 RepID=A0AAW1GQM2_SAPOF
MTKSETEFRALDEKSLLEYIKSTPSLSSVLKTCDNLEIKEIGDGNLNLVYILLHLLLLLLSLNRHCRTYAA